MPESVMEERPDSITGVEAVRSAATRLIASTAGANGKVIGNGNALTATAKRVQYGVRITLFYNLLEVSFP
jgi:hypothetical protein